MTDHSAGIHSAVTAAETSTDARRRPARTYTYVPHVRTRTSYVLLTVYCYVTSCWRMTSDISRVITAARHHHVHTQTARRRCRQPSTSVRGTAGYWCWTRKHPRQTAPRSADRR